MTLLSRVTAISENIRLDFDSPYVLLNHALRVPVVDAKDLENKVTKGTWEEFFKTYDNVKGLEDFMVDREQDIPRDYVFAMLKLY